MHKKQGVCVSVCVHIHVHVFKEVKKKQCISLKWTSINFLIMTPLYLCILFIQNYYNKTPHLQTYLEEGHNKFQKNLNRDKVVYYVLLIRSKFFFSCRKNKIFKFYEALWHRVIFSKKLFFSFADYQFFLYSSSFSHLLVVSCIYIICTNLEFL